MNKVIMRKVKDNLVEKGGAFVKEDIWVLDTIGTNLMGVLGLDYIDTSKTISNDIMEMQYVLGIEAARQCLFNELSEVLEFDGAYVNAHHMSLLCDRMTYNIEMTSMFRHGINNDDIGPIAKASFEETPEMFLKAARHAELDTLRGISANVMCGQEGLFGTAAFQVVLDLEEMKNQASYVYKEINFDELMDEDDEPNTRNTCNVKKLQIRNNVNCGSMSTVHQEENISNDYDPFADM